MHSRIARLFPLFCIGVVAGSCGPDRALAPEASQPLLAAVGGTSFSLTSTPVSYFQIDLGWADVSTNESGFELGRSTTGPSGTFAILTTTGPNVTSFSDVSLSAATQYCYRIRLLRTTGRKTSYSAFSNTTCATTRPLAPSNANATPVSSSGVDITWTDNSTSESGFRLERSASMTGPWEMVANTAANLTSHRDLARTNEQQVCYRVTASSSSGDSEPSNVDCTTPLAAPTSLTAVTADQGIDLNWSDNSAVEDGYEVQRSTDGVTFTTVAQLPGSSTSYRDRGATISGTFWYQVRGRKDGGFSDLSNVATAQGGCVPTGTTENVCDDGADDDCDGLVDSADPDCPRCSQFELDCSNGVDEDCDDLVDVDDPDCSPSGCGEACPSGYYCIDDVCVSHCNDGVRNGDESAIDCGGGCGSTCQAGQRCNGNWDCQSQSCVNHVCQPPATIP